MHCPEVTLYCANPLCQAANPVNCRFCQQCRSLLVKRYLWLVGTLTHACQPGVILSDRYQCTQERVFLDTKPALLPDFPEEIPSIVESYLRLISIRPHTPQVYTVLSRRQANQPDLYLLENAPIYPAAIVPDQAQADIAGRVMPEMTMVWGVSSGFRQLNWLWQLAQLWEPLQKEGVAQTILTPALIRVEGSLVRLLELQATEVSPQLAQLGEVWRSWLPEARSDIADFLQHLCQQLVEEQITTSEQLIQQLDQAIVHRSQTHHLQLRVATLTDQGPTRQRNEDACYPSSGSVVDFSLTGSQLLSAAHLPLTIVCDGIGGHEGGDVASHLAIATLQQQLQSPVHFTDNQPQAVIEALERATLTANDAIAQRNDAEQRQERQRMGTTLVMALAQHHQIFFTHIGDSRAYRITSTGCHQITLDDDLAAREVRLGYSPYREALRQPSAGSLVQALGMNPSRMLRPTVRRFLLDEDCVFLLCSDGLSDHDRVDEFWQPYIVPILNGSLDLAKAAQQLVAIANQRNGHDNVTVGLIYCRVIPSLMPPAGVPASLLQQDMISDYTPRQTAPASSSFSTARTKNLLGLKQTQPRQLFWIVFLLALVIGGLATFLLVQGINLFESGQPPSNGLPLPTNSGLVTVPPSASPTSSFTAGTRLLVNRAIPGSTGAIALFSRPGDTTDPTISQAAIPTGSVLEVMSQRAEGLNQRWLQVRVCSVASKLELAAEPGAVGWVAEATIAPLVTANVSLTPAQLGTCGVERRVDGR